MSKHLSKTELLNELRVRQGLIPISIDAATGKVFWLDFGKYHFYEGFLHKSINTLSALKNNEIYEVSSDLEVFQDGEILTDSIYPNGFIFHAGRCGSTLLAKAFARSRKSLVLSEVAAHNQIWFALTGNGAKKITAAEENIYKNLILATARRRIASHQFCVIKFTSYNIFFYEFIRRAFPDVPAVFLYRQPSEILSSLNKNTSEWMRGENAQMRQLLTNTPESRFYDLNYEQYQNKIIAELFSAALKARENSLACFNYRELNAENFPYFCRKFSTNFDEAEMKLMKTQFEFYSKAENKQVDFAEKTGVKKGNSDNFFKELPCEETQDLYQRLENLSLFQDKS